MWLGKDGPMASWSKLPGTTRFAALVAIAMVLVITVVFATREKANTQGSQASASGTSTATADELPATVTREWCGRLGARQEPRLTAQAQAKYPGRDVSAVRDYVLNMVNNCIADVGSPLAPHWRCRWDEAFENDTCSAMEKAAKGDAKRRREVLAGLSFGLTKPLNPLDDDQVEMVKTACAKQGKPPLWLRCDKVGRKEPASPDECVVLAEALSCVQAEAGTPRLFCCPASTPHTIE